MRPLKYFALHKPYGYLSQFTDSHSKSGLLGELYHFPKDVYAVGRLDKDSEGLLFLTNDKAVNHQFLNPENKHARTYWVQLDGEITNEAISQLEKGVSISVNKKKYQTKTCNVERLQDEEIWFPERIPPPRIKHGCSWISISLIEGKNRQVRKMTAAVGFPTLRLVRVLIEDLSLKGLLPGQVKSFEREEVYKLLKLD